MADTMNTLFRKAAGVCTAAAIAVAAAGHAQAMARRAPGASHRDKLDLHLRAALEGKGARESQRVIIRVAPGGQAALRRMLADRGDPIVAEHQSIEAFTAVVHTEDLDALAAGQQIVSVSSDAVVRAKLLGGLLGGVLNLVGGMV